MSGRTTPLPLIWNQGLFGGRIFIEWLALRLPIRVFVSWNIGRLQKQDITSSGRGQGIAATAIEHHDDVFHPRHISRSHFRKYFEIEYVSFMIALMMDMEYACLDGYQKKTVYCKSSENHYVYCKRKDDSSIVEEKVFGLEMDLFQLWKKQVVQTEKVIRQYPWNFRIS